MELKLQFLAIRGDRAVLKIESDGREVLWPSNILPSGVLEGDFFNFYITDSSLEIEKGKKLAKDILNEILNAE